MSNVGGLLGGRLLEETSAIVTVTSDSVVPSNLSCRITKLPGVLQPWLLMIFHLVKTTVVSSTSRTKKSGYNDEILVVFN